MISYNSTQTKYANKSFNAIIKHLLNTYDMVRAEDKQICYSHLRKLTIYLEKQNPKVVVLKGTGSQPLTCDQGGIQAQ